jgi:general L-amino acid transport system substrate-binding protein
MKQIALAAAVGWTALTGTAAEAQPALSSRTLDAVRARGLLICGVSTGTAGFALPDSRGEWQGLDVDMCRGLAAAILNDPSRVRFVPLSNSVRFAATTNGEIDVLFRNSTQTLMRDTTLGLRHATTYFYDGMSFLVRGNSGINRAVELAGATICILQGTTTEQVTSEFFRTANLTFTPLLFERLDQAMAAIVAGRCDAYANDGSSLAAVRATLPNGRDYRVLEERLSKEPYAAFVRQGDELWYSIVRWFTNAMIEAEELGVTRANAEEMRRSSTNPNVRRLLGHSPEIGESMRLHADWAYTAVRAVGNYGEMYERHMGPSTVVNLPRGANNLWNRGGLLYALPIR